MRGLSLVGAAVALALSLSAAVADDWHAAKLRGKVLQLVDGQWEPLLRGDVVPDDRVIRTLGSGRVTFVRGNEMVDLGGNTQIQIHDRNGSRPFTTVLQHFGKVEVEAEVQQVQHFAVQTPYLVAVVKGTRFTVLSSETESRVRVRRGAVAVENSADGSNTVVVAGQTAEVAAGEALQVAGRGKLPAVLDAKGMPSEPEKRAGNGQGNAGGTDANSGNSSKGSGPAAGNAVSNAVNAVGNTTSNVVNATSNTVSDTTSNVVSATSNTVSNTTNTVTNTLGGVLGAIGNR
jgi:hypothetical protein